MLYFFIIFLTLLSMPFNLEIAFQFLCLDTGAQGFVQILYEVLLGIYIFQNNIWLH